MRTNLTQMSLEQLLERKQILQHKLASLNGRQMAFKILANSLYGAMSQIGFRYYDIRIAEAITMTGQASDRHIEMIVNQYMNEVLKPEQPVDYVIGGDTDSIYLDVNLLVKRAFEGKNPSTKEIVTFLDKVCDTKFQEQINKSIDIIYNTGNCYERIMNMKREAIASKAIWTAKKRYAMMVHNSEGVDYTPFKMKIMGMDLIKSSTPLYIREKLKNALLTIFEKDQEALYEFVASVKKEFLSMPVEQIAFPRGCNDLTKYADNVSIFKKGTPIHVRGSLVYNYINKDNKDITLIRDGDKVRFIYLKVPNPAREDVISFPAFSTLPVNMGLHSYVDREKQWDKVFIAPLKGICDAIRWRPERTASLELFFG